MAIISTMAKVMDDDELLDAVSRGQVMWTPNNYCTDHSYKAWAPLFKPEQRDSCSPFKTEFAPEHTRTIPGSFSEATRAGKNNPSGTCNSGECLQGFYLFFQAGAYAKGVNVMLMNRLDGYNDPVLGTNQDNEPFKMCYDYLVDLGEDRIAHSSVKTGEMWGNSRKMDKEIVLGMSEMLFAVYRDDDTKIYLQSPPAGSRTGIDTLFYGLDLNDALDSNPPNPPTNPIEDFVGIAQAQVSWAPSYQPESDGFDNWVFKYIIEVDNVPVGETQSTRFFLEGLQPDTQYRVDIIAEDYFGYQSTEATIYIQTLPA
jgi:hypothetical protein